MATKYLGGEFDIHGGGLDLKFPHHENEIAQAHAAGDGFARYWMHNGWVTMAGEKMSKSLGNVLSVPELLKQVRPIELRYYLGSANYRSMVEYSPEALQDAAAGLRRVEKFVRAVADLAGADATEPTTVTDEFANAMNDDLGVPAALAAIHGAVREGNGLLAKAAKDADAQQQIATIAGQVRAMMGVLGVDPLDPKWNTGGGANEAEHHALDVLIQAQLQERADARAAKDWERADAVRDRLAEAGIVVTDTAEGARWRIDG